MTWQSGNSQFQAIHYLEPRVMICLPARIEEVGSQQDRLIKVLTSLTNVMLFLSPIENECVEPETHNTQSPGERKFGTKCIIYVKQ